jgi:hypothetical protein
MECVTVVKPHAKPLALKPKLGNCLTTPTTTSYSKKAKTTETGHQSSNNTL